MSRPILHIARASKPAVPRSLIKQAVALWRSDTAPRAVRRANARRWIAMRLWMGTNHVLHITRPAVKWGTQKGIRT